MATPKRTTLTKSVWAYALALLVMSTAQAATFREIATDQKVTIEVAQNYPCSTSVPLQIRATSAQFFEQETQRIQRLVRAARMVVSFECDRVTRLPIRGLVDKVEYFKASADKSRKWKLAVKPSELSAGLKTLQGIEHRPAEALTLAVRLIRKYRTVPGASSVSDFNRIIKIAQNLIRKSVGTTDTDLTGYFDATLQASASEQIANAQFDALENALAEFSPDRLAPFKTSRQRIVSTARETPAQDSLAETLSTPQNDFIPLMRKLTVVIEQKTLAKTVRQGMRQQAISHISRQFLEPLALDDELSWLSDVAYSVDTAKTLRRSLARVPGSPLKTAVSAQVNLVLKQGLSRLGQIRRTAQDAIDEMDAPYDELGALLEASERIAAEFEEHGFRTVATSLRSGAAYRAQTILARDLPQFKQTLAVYPTDQQSLTTLRWQTQAFTEISTEIPGFSAYADAAQKSLEAMSPLVCAGIAKKISTKLRPANDSEAIAIGVGENQTMSLRNFVCDAQENGYQVESMEQTGAVGSIELKVRNDEGNLVAYRLNSTKLADGKQALIGDKLVADATEELSPDAWFGHVLTLTGTGYSGEPDDKGITKCDLFAADPFDSQRRSQGRTWPLETLDFAELDKALDACIAAVEFRPTDATQLYQLGRLLALSGNDSDARHFLTKASRQAYSPATFQLAGIVMNDADRKDAFYDAVDLYRIAARKKYKPAIAMMAELEPKGQKIYRPLPAPTERQLASAFPKNECVSNFGVEVCKRVVGSEIKSCFQTSAARFSCEWRPIMRCSTNVSSAHSMIIQKACNNTEFGFGNFRKNKNGSWTFISG